MTKYMIGTILITMFSALTGCATLTGKELRQQKVYDCTMTFVQEEVAAGEAEDVCSNIYTKKGSKR